VKSHVDPYFSVRARRGYVEVVKLVHILRTEIFTYEKFLEHYHVQGIAGRCYDMQLDAIILS
jgi:hypothetical protein